MRAGVFLMSRLRIAVCKKLMPTTAQTPQGLTGTCDPHADLNSSCHSTGRNWCKAFPYVFPISLGLVAPSLLLLLPNAILRKMHRRYHGGWILPLLKAKREGDTCSFSAYFIPVRCLKSICYQPQAAEIIKCCTNQTAKR